MSLESFQSKPLYDSIIRKDPKGQENDMHFDNFANLHVLPLL